MGNCASSAFFLFLVQMEKNVVFFPGTMWILCAPNNDAMGCHCNRHVVTMIVLEHECRAARLCWYVINGLRGVFVL